MRVRCFYIILQTDFGLLLELIQNKTFLFCSWNNVALFSISTYRVCVFDELSLMVQRC